jgi:hypothetical protein
VQLLIDRGADVTAKDKAYSTPLHLASSQGSAETVQLLIGCYADVAAQDTCHTPSFPSYHHHLLVLVLVYPSLHSLRTPSSARLVSSRTRNLCSLLCIHQCSPSLALAATVLWALTTPTTPNHSYLLYGCCKNKEVLHLPSRTPSAPALPSRQSLTPPPPPPTVSFGHHRMGTHAFPTRLPNPLQYHRGPTGGTCSAARSRPLPLTRGLPNHGR